VRRGFVLVAAVALGGRVLVSAPQVPELPKQFGASITGSMEGWFGGPDGGHRFLVGYYNRNSQQELDIPIGPNNRIEPGGPDLGQPTHFLAGRQIGIFVVPATASFKPTDSFKWTLVVNGQTTVIPLRLNPLYEIDPFTEAAVQNTPPIVRFEPAGPGVQGPIATLATASVRTVAAAAPLAITVWVSDDMKATSGTSTPPPASRQPVTIRWSKFRGPGTVTFDNPRPALQKVANPPAATAAPFNGTATTTVRFGQAGDYVLHLVANDYSGDGSGAAGAFGCCWTTTLVKVNVTP
jgi:hypothetical protein